MKKIMCVMAMVTVSVILCGCPQTQNSADVQQTKQSERMFSEAQAEIGMPNIVNFQQRKLMKMIFELCDKENLITYTYIKSDYSGTLNFIGKSIGYGVPFSAQFTNPAKVIDARDIVGGTERKQMSIPQADPNGLFMPTSSSATWIMMIDEESGEARPVYFEPEIVVSPFLLHKEGVVQ